MSTVYTVHSNFHAPLMHSVGIWFNGDVVTGTLRAGDDLDVVDYFSLREDFPALAFPTDNLVVQQLQSELY